MGETAQAPASALEKEEDTYAILLNAPVERVYSSATDFLCPMLQCSEEDLWALMRSAPAVLLRNLDYKTAQKSMEILDRACGYPVTPINDVYADTLENALNAPPVAALQRPPKEPMSFGMTVAAVALGIVAALLLLSLF